MDPIFILESEIENLKAAAVQRESLLNNHQDAIDIFVAEIESAKQVEQTRLSEINQLKDELISSKEANQKLKDLWNEKVRKLREKLQEAEKAQESLESQLATSHKSQLDMTELLSRVKRAGADVTEGSKVLTELESLVADCIPELPFAGRGGSVPSYNIPLDVMTRCIAHSSGYGITFNQVGHEEKMVGYLEHIKKAVEVSLCSISKA